MGQTYTVLSISERIQIQAMHEARLSCRAIARQLNRAPTTITRELAKNKYRKAPSAAGKVSKRQPSTTAPNASNASNAPSKASPIAPLTHRYIGAQAHDIAAQRRRTGRNAARRIPPSWDTLLALTVRNELALARSPEQISGRLKRMNLNDPALHLSAETIYASIYLTPRGELRSELISQLRRNHAKRMPRSRGANRQSKLVNPVSIDQRDPVVGERTTPGHWEADLIKGAYNRSAIGTIVERQSRFLLLSAVGGCTAAHVLKGFTARLKTVPSPLLQTLTYDRGSEMACHEALAKRFDMAIYFCDPHAPWQRGSNENMNGLVRQFLPKGMDLSSVTPQKLAYIEMALNTRPRKVLNYATPLEVMNALKSGVSFEQAIALP